MVVICGEVRAPKTEMFKEFNELQVSKSCRFNIDLSLNVIRGGYALN